MAISQYTDQIDPQNIIAVMGKNWLYNTKLVQGAPNIFIRDVRPVEGSLTTTVRNKFFQGSSGQVVAPGAAISSVGRVQNSEIHPIIWRDGAIDEDYKIMDVISKASGAQSMEAEYVQACNDAASQWFEDAFIKMIEGVGAAITANQTGSGAIVTLAGMIAAKAALADNGLVLQGGATLMNSAIYWKLAGLGVVAATSNTFGNAAQDAMVQSGSLPETVVGLTPIMSDKVTAAPSSKNYVYFLGPNSVVVRGNDSADIRMADKTVIKEQGMVTTLRLAFGLGARNATWGKAASVNISDTDLSTAANWSGSDTNDKYVRIARYHTNES